MELFSLLQKSLEQSIDWESLEVASRSVPSVAMADCAAIHRGLFGMVISGLPHAEALAFQSALLRQGFPTEVVADRELPVLHPKFTVQRVDLMDGLVRFTDAMGRVQDRLHAELVFVAGGFLGAREPESFRLDFFFWQAPNRLRLAIRGSSVILFNGRALQMKNLRELRGALALCGVLLPPERLTMALKSPQPESIYPGGGALDEEIRWHFHQLRSTR